MTEVVDALREIARDICQVLGDPEATRERAEEIPPRIEHVNVFEDHAVLRDNVLKRTVFVYSRDGSLSCDLCEGTYCIHTRYVETLR